MNCNHGGEVYDHSYREWRYTDGLPVVECPDCGAKRTLQIVTRSLGQRGDGCYEDMLIYPHHKAIKGIRPTLYNASDIAPEVPHTNRPNTEQCAVCQNHKPEHTMWHSITSNDGICDNCHEQGWDFDQEGKIRK